MRTAGAVRIEYPIETVRAKAYRIPVEQQPRESDGTLTWSSTTLVVAEVIAGDVAGMGYTYADASAAQMINGLLAPRLQGSDALATSARYADMCAAIRNNGRSGITAMSLSALDIALWDLKGKVLNVPVYVLLGAARSSVPIYGSGGFTSYGVQRLQEQLGHWVRDMRIPRVKMKVGRDPAADADRVAKARTAIGTDAELYVDANGAYVVRQAIKMAQRFAQSGVSWFEEPVYHNDLKGNARVRAHVPAGMEVSNGEYGYAPQDFLQIIEGGAADVLQADVTRCGGYTGFMAADALCLAHDIPLSSHCAPYVTLQAAAAAKMLRHLEYFHDHVLIEQRFFDGALQPQGGMLTPQCNRPGIGLDFKAADARDYLA